MEETTTISHLQSFLNIELEVHKMFLDSQLVNDILIHHRNNIEATLNSLYEIFPSQCLPKFENVLRKKKEEFLRRKFTKVPVQVVKECLVKNRFQMNDVLLELIQIEQEKHRGLERIKIRNLQKLFPEMEKQHVVDALEANKWDENRSANHLALLQRSEILPKQPTQQDFGEPAPSTPEKMIHYKEEGKKKILKGLERAFTEDPQQSPTEKRVKKLDLNKISLQESRIIQETNKQLGFLSADDISMILDMYNWNEVAMHALLKRDLDLFHECLHSHCPEAPIEVVKIIASSYYPDKERAIAELSHANYKLTALHKEVVTSKKNLEKEKEFLRRIKSPEIAQGWGKKRVEEKEKIYESFKREYQDLLKDIATKGNPVRSSVELQQDLIVLYRGLMKKEIPTIFDKREAKAKKAKPPPDSVKRARSEKWLFSPELFLSKNWISRGGYEELVISPDTFPQDFKEVHNIWKKQSSNHPKQEYTIKSITAIKNNRLQIIWERLKYLQQIDLESPAFSQDWKDHFERETAKTLRHKIMERFETFPLQKENGVSIIPVFHGTNREAAKKIASAGFAALGKTDPGFFGFGVYSTIQPDYAARVYGMNGVVILSYLAIGNVYPFIKSDVRRGGRQALMPGYHGHYASVIPPQGGIAQQGVYTALKPGENSITDVQYDEFVVDQRNYLIPRYIIEYEVKDRKEEQTIKKNEKQEIKTEESYSEEKLGNISGERSREWKERAKKIVLEKSTARRGKLSKVSSTPTPIISATISKSGRYLSLKKSHLAKTKRTTNRQRFTVSGPAQHPKKMSDLTDEEFERIFNMTREKFDKLNWFLQQDLKKKKNIL